MGKLARAKSSINSLQRKTTLEGSMLKYEDFRA